MSYIIIFITLFALLHFGYEGIVAPILKLKYRHKLFTLRDKLHNIKLQDNENSDVIELIESGVEGFLDRMDELTFSQLSRAKKIYEEDKEAHSKIMQIESTISNCKNEELKMIDKQLMRIAKKILMINSGGWLFYIIPIALVAIPITKIKNYIKNSLKDFIFMPHPTESLFAFK